MPLRSDESATIGLTTAPGGARTANPDPPHAALPGVPAMEHVGHPKEETRRGRAVCGFGRRRMVRPT